MTLRYEEYGSGPLVVLIHGSPGSARAWERVGRRLSSRFRIVAPNLPGYGGSDPRPADIVTDTAWVARQVEEVLTEIGRAVVLAGHSYGGNVALAVGIRGRVAIDGLALFEPVAVPVLRAIGEEHRYLAARAVFDGYFASHERGDDKAIRTMADFWFGPGAFDAMPQNAQEALTRATALNVQDVKATFREQYSRSDLEGLTIPVLLAHGSRSPVLTSDIVDAIARHVPRSTVVTLEGANHAMTTTHDGAVAQLIADHAARCAGPEGRPGTPAAGRP